MNTIIDKQKIVWITGSSSGIGLALTNKFLEEGHIVIASSRTKKTSNSNPNLFYKQADVTDISSIKECIDFIANKFNRIDIAILNAGVCEYIDLPELDVTKIRNNIDVNFYGVLNCFVECKALLERSKCPQLVSMSSAAVYLPFARAEGYGASKAANLYLMQALQIHLQDKIHVSVILPGFVKTPLTDKNAFKMPFLMHAHKAANYIYKSILKKKLIIEFPWQLIFLLKAIRVMPYRIKKIVLQKMAGQL